MWCYCYNVLFLRWLMMMLEMLLLQCLNLDEILRCLAAIARRSTPGSSLSDRVTQRADLSDHVMYYSRSTASRDWTFIRGWFNAVLILGKRQQRWPNNKPTLSHHQVIARKAGCIYVNGYNLTPIVCTQQTRHVETMMFKCWPSVYDAGPTFKHYYFNVSCFLGR